MRVPGGRTGLYAAVFVAAFILFAYLLLTYTRRVDGVSMTPTFQTGDMVVVEPVNINDVHVGNIIVYDGVCSATGEAVIHRVVEIDDGLLFTKGDNANTNPLTDQALGIATQPIKQSCLVGRVVFVIPYIELIASLPYGLNYLLAIALLLVVLYSEFGRGKSSADSVAS